MRRRRPSASMATPQLVEALRKDLGLDRPVLVRYFEWLGGFVHGDFGLSLPSKEPVVEIIGNRIQNTGMLALLIRRDPHSALAVARHRLRRPSRPAIRSLGGRHFARPDLDAGVRRRQPSGARPRRVSSAGFRRPR